MSEHKPKNLVNVTKKNQNKLNKTVGVFGQRCMCGICGEGAIFGIDPTMDKNHEQWVHEEGMLVSKNGHRVAVVPWDEDIKLLEKLRKNPLP